MAYNGAQPRTVGHAMPEHRIIDTAMGKMAHLGSVQLHGQQRALACTCYGNGMACLLAIDPDGMVYAKLTTNVDPA